AVGTPGATRPALDRRPRRGARRATRRTRRWLSLESRASHYRAAPGYGLCRRCSRWEPSPAHFFVEQSADAALLGSDSLQLVQLGDEAITPHLTRRPSAGAAVSPHLRW